MKNYKKPDLGDDYSGIETIKRVVKEVQGEYKHSVIEDILGYVLWILDDYKNMKQGDGTNFSIVTKSPEALAEFIVKLVDDCTIRHECGICHSWCDEKVVSSWLKQESE